MDKRLITVIVVDKGNTYHRIKFKNNLYLGDPINICKIYSEKNSDEIVVFDVSRNTSLSLLNSGKLERILENVFVPISYGGGINSENDIDKIFKVGVDKIILNYHNKKSQSLSIYSAKKYGEQSVILCFNVLKSKHFQNRKKAVTNLNLEYHLLKLNCYSYGELMLQDIELSGTREGPNIDAILTLKKYVEKPLIYSGGISNSQEIAQLLNMDIDVAASTIFSLHRLTKTPLISYLNYDARSNL